MVKYKPTDTEKSMLEKDFQASVIAMAVDLGYIVGFTYDSRRSRPGEPDLRMVHPTQHRVIFAELKREGYKLSLGHWKNGNWQTGQDEWAEALGACPGVEYYFWFPHHLDEIVEILQAA